LVEGVRGEGEMVVVAVAVEASEAVALEAVAQAVVAQVVAATVVVAVVVVASAAEATEATMEAVVVVMDTELSHLQTAGCDQYRCRCPSM